MQRKLPKNSSDANLHTEKNLSQLTKVLVAKTK